ncbi:hypothetical protein J8F10_02745 [Gemmata sp. G18]|uniref:Uncharacterized protein n=1 Tax=Gemmata palustris TaxID=2822762 RepID=A0ABS5BKI0_9BACT|nr:hypothetical protein [Gemmata palustris]MBP3954213.1 hypothetical protein [Gemmata palustris]
MTLEDFAKMMSITPVLAEDVPGKSSTGIFRKLRDEFVDSLLPGDTVYFYDSNEADWQKTMGREGYILVRQGVIVADLMTKMN